MNSTAERAIASAGRRANRVQRTRLHVAAVALAVAVAVIVVTPGPAAGEHVRPTEQSPVARAGAAYWLVAADGGVFSFGDAAFAGSTGNLQLNQPIVGSTATPTGNGYWLVAADGGVFSFGDAAFAGSTGNLRLNKPIVGMAATPTGDGYWLVAADGGVFAFGDAAFFGSTGNIRLSRPMVGMAATPTGDGYWLVAADGGVFAFGDAAFFGSTGNIRLSRPMVGMAATPTGDGYWLVASDGGVFAFGDAAFFGSTGNIRLNAPVVGMVSTAVGRGYWLTASDGGVFAFGDAPFVGSMGGTRLNRPVVALAGGLDRRAFEVWALDQAGDGGTLLVYDGARLALRSDAATPEVFGLDGAVKAMCVASTGAAPIRAHMLVFNHGGTHAIISYVATGHVVFMDAASRRPVACVRAAPGAGGQRQAHAAVAAPDDSYVVVANQNGKLLERIDTDADGDGRPYEDAADIAAVPGATLDLAGCTTPSGAPCQEPTLRPDNAPICPVVDSSSRLVFVTLRGGGMLVVDGRTTPMRIVAEYDRATVHPNGCGGVEQAGKMYINSGGGTPGNPAEADLYAFPLSGYPATGAAPVNQPAPKVVFSDDAGDHDSHGAQLTGGGRYLWVADRFGNAVDVVDTVSDERVGRFGLAGAASSDPAPDLLDVAPHGGTAFVSLRGPCPLTANSGANNAVGATPGVGVIDVVPGGASGRLMAVAPVSRPAPANFDCPSRADDAAGSITNTADVHALRVRFKHQ